MFLVKLKITANTSRYSNDNDMALRNGKPELIEASSEHSRPGSPKDSLLANF